MLRACKTCFAARAAARAIKCVFDYDVKVNFLCLLSRKIFYAFSCFDLKEFESCQISTRVNMLALLF